MASPNLSGRPSPPDRFRVVGLYRGLGLDEVHQHLLDLGGLGVRDLCPDGDDLLVLAGPSMALSGPVRLHRWHRAAHAETSRVVRGTELTLETELPHGTGEDHAEGIALLGEAADARLLVVYDSPAQQRRPTTESVLADRVRIGQPATSRPAHRP